MKNLLLTLFILLQLPVIANDIFDDTELLKNINDIDSRFYYPALMSRYLDGDLDLTLEDYQHLYYGFAYNDNYEPYKTVNDNGLIYYTLSLEDPTEADYLGVIRFLESSLYLEPFNIENINLLTFFYDEIKDSENTFKNAYRLNMIIKTIMSSGSGKKEKSPFQIIYPSHSEDIMAFIGIPHKNKMVVSIYCDYYPLYKKVNGTKGYYFDFRRMLLKEREVKETNTDNKGFEINGIKLK
ncbi:MAG: DUF4919 domain-containing protein [Rikenellaceae bacterium]|nr:DUF4919 domain-containing protein [Rikenellaceae bacterium]